MDFIFKKFFSTMLENLHDAWDRYDGIEEMEKKFRNLCMSAPTGEIKDFLESLSAREQRRFNQYVHTGFIGLLHRKQYDSMRLVLEQPFLRVPASKEFKIILNEYMLTLVVAQRLPELSHLCQESRLKDSLDFSSNDCYGLRYACVRGNVQVARLFLESKKITPDAINKCFLTCCNNQHQGLINLFVFEQAIELSETLFTQLVEQDLSHILELFEKRELNRSLHDTLASKEGKRNKTKI